MYVVDIGIIDLRDDEDLFLQRDVATEGRARRTLHTTALSLLIERKISGRGVGMCIW
jgi:hypothetical protein